MNDGVGPAAPADDRRTTTPRPAADVGLFGGTFNPIHVGHLRAAEEAAEALGLARVLFVPSAQPPHKAASGGDPLAPAALRLAWARAATASNPRFAVDPIELERDGPSYSIDTVRELAARLSPSRLVFVIGQDAFVEIASWRKPEALLAAADFAILTRPPALEGSLARWLPPSLAGDFALEPGGMRASHRIAGTRLVALEITALDVSSSDIRARLRSGRSVRYLLPDAIHDAVVESGVYGPPSAARSVRSENSPEERS
jgi:nicotinate-nucleotide adenylyltransferase